MRDANRHVAVLKKQAARGIHLETREPLSRSLNFDYAGHFAPRIFKVD
jgi:hypothetical protein